MLAMAESMPSTLSDGNATNPFSFKYTPSTLTYFLLGLCILVLFTRLYSSRKSASVPGGNNGGHTVPAVPYWLPIIGHIPNMAYDADGFIKGLRKAYDNGIFGLNFGGTKHNIVYSSGLATALLNQKSSNADAEHVSDKLLQDVFGFPSSEMDKWYKSRDDLMQCYKYLLTEPALGTMVEKTTRKIRENVLNLVSFTTSPVDQMLWERTSRVQVKQNAAGDEVVEASFLPLIRDFCAHTANPSIMGSNFLAKFPDFFEEIWTLDRGFLLLATGLPRWVPIPIVTRAHIARKKIIDMICTFHEAMEREANGEDAGPDWRDLDDVGALVKARMEVYRKFDWSIPARAAVEHSLMWAANANSNTLVFWMLNRIYADPQLLAMLRKEIDPYAKAIQPKQEFPIPEPSRLENLDIEGLCNNCALLKSCYVECLRLDTASWSLKIVKQDFVLQSRERDAQAWLLRKGEYAHAAHDLHNTDPNCFENPMAWKADRHIKYADGGQKKQTADLGSIRPYGEYHKLIFRVGGVTLTVIQVVEPACAKVAPSPSRSAWHSLLPSSRSGTSSLLEAANGRCPSIGKLLAYIVRLTIHASGSSDVCCQRRHEW